eukprot:TRINITY_DN3006_c1_g1_i1.p1 TRINITY_DN3006_c1_g1~~TRINITY_DN3006_c1_g1_i1.p1  ORF type:complete len:210 (-),score=-4.67 TRINITY_DN3006_c1_g1_i1:142-747(-)
MGFDVKHEFKRSRKHMLVIFVLVLCAIVVGIVSISTPGWITTEYSFGNSKSKYEYGLTKVKWCVTVLNIKSCYNGSTDGSTSTSGDTALAGAIIAIILSVVFLITSFVHAFKQEVGPLKAIHFSLINLILSALIFVTWFGCATFLYPLITGSLKESGYNGYSQTYGYSYILGILVSVIYLVVVAGCAFDFFSTRKNRYQAI